MKILEESYLKEKYDIALFANQVRQIENIFDLNEYDNIIESKEQLEMTKKIIEYYLNYVVEKNFDSISNNFI
jgi:hypothetical protein